MCRGLALGFNWEKGVICKGLSSHTETLEKEEDNFLKLEIIIDEEESRGFVVELDEQYSSDCYVQEKFPDMITKTGKIKEEILELFNTWIKKNETQVYRWLLFNASYARRIKDINNSYQKTKKGNFYNNYQKTKKGNINNYSQKIEKGNIDNGCQKIEKGAIYNYSQKIEKGDINNNRQKTKEGNINNGYQEIEIGDINNSNQKTKKGTIYLAYCETNNKKVNDWIKEHSTLLTKKGIQLDLGYIVEKAIEGNN